MATIAELIVKASLNNRDLERGFSVSTRRARAFAEGLEGIGARLTVLSAGLVAIGGASLKAASDLQNLRKGLEAVAGGAEQARVQYARLVELAKAPGIGFEEAIRGSVRLQAVGFSALTAERGLKAFANAIALTGGGREELQRVTVQMGQLAAKGKVLAQDLRPIIENAPAVGTALRDAFGTIDSEAIQALNLTTEQFFDRLFTSLEKLPQVTGGASNAWDNFKDSAKRALAGLTEDLLPAVTLRLNNLAERITVLGEAWRSLSPETRRIVLGIAGLTAVLGPALLAVSTLTRAYITLKGVLVATSIVQATQAWAAMTVGMGATARAVSFLGFAFRGLLTFFTGPAGLLVGIGLVVGALVRAKIKAAELAQSFRDEVAAMSREVAEFRFGTISDDLSTVNAEIARLQSLQRNTAGGAFAGKTGFQDESALRRARELNELQARRNTLLEQFRVITSRLSELNRGPAEVATAGGNNFGTGTGGGEDEKKQKTFLQIQQEIVEVLTRGAELGLLSNKQREQAVALESQLRDLALQQRDATTESIGLLELANRLRERAVPTPNLTPATLSTPLDAGKALNWFVVESEIAKATLRTKEATKEARRFEDTLEAIGDSGRGLSSIFRGFASVSDRIFGKMSRVVDSIAGDIGNLSAQLKEFSASSFTSFSQALTSGAALGAIGSIVSIGATVLGSLFSGNSEWAQTINRNREALDALRLELQGFRLTFEVQSNVGAGIEALLARRGFLENSGAGFLGRPTPGRQKDRIEAILADFGLTLAELNAAAQKFGIELYDSQGRVILGAVAQLGEALEMSAKSVSDFAATVEGRRKLLDARNDIFDVSDPAALLQGQFDLLQGLAPELLKQFGLANLNLQTATGRAVLEQGLRDLITQLGQGAIDAGLLSGFESVDEFIQHLRDTDNALDAFAETATKAGGSLVNAVEGFKVAAYRFRAQEAQSRIVTPTSRPTDTGGTTRPTQPVPPVVVQGGALHFHGTDPQENYRTWYRHMVELSRANPSMRTFVDSLTPA